LFPSPIPCILTRSLVYLWPPCFDWYGQCKPCTLHSSCLPVAPMFWLVRPMQALHSSCLPVAPMFWLAQPMQALHSSKQRSSRMLSWDPSAHSAGQSSTTSSGHCWRAWVLTHVVVRSNGRLVSVCVCVCVCVHLCLREGNVHGRGWICKVSINTFR